MKRSRALEIISRVLVKHTGKTVEFVADRVLQTLKLHRLIETDMTCDFCEKPCDNNWCESRYKKGEES